MLLTLLLPLFLPWEPLVIAIEQMPQQSLEYFQPVDYDYGYTQAPVVQTTMGTMGPVQTLEPQQTFEPASQTTTGMLEPVQGPEQTMEPLPAPDSSKNVNSYPFVDKLYDLCPSCSISRDELAICDGATIMCGCNDAYDYMMCFITPGCSPNDAVAECQCTPSTSYCENRMCSPNACTSTGECSDMFYYYPNASLFSNTCQCQDGGPCDAESTTTGSASTSSFIELYYDICDCDSTPAVCDDGIITCWCTPTGTTDYTCIIEPGCNAGDAPAICQCTGQECNVSLCESNTCMNGGTCQEAQSAYGNSIETPPFTVCICPDPYTGEKCENVQSTPGANFPFVQELYDKCNCTSKEEICDQADIACACADFTTDVFCGILPNCVSGEIQHNCTCPMGSPTGDKMCKVDQCSSAPCLNAGSCIENRGYHPNSTQYESIYVCACVNGFTGKNCELVPTVPGENFPFVKTVYDNCQCTSMEELCDEAEVWCSCYVDNAEMPCTVLPTCFVGQPQINCTCPSGVDWADNLCKPELCVSNPCQNAAECSDDRSYYANSTLYFKDYYCDCLLGFEGDNCEINIDDCAGSPCGVGTCIDGIDTYECECPTGYQQPNCEKAPSSPGDNFPFVKELYDNCDCPIKEEICDLADISCACATFSTEVECGIMPNCVAGETQLNCTCTVGSDTGDKFCKVEHCLSDPCQNGALCQDDNRYHSNSTQYESSYTCYCELGFNGTNCEINIDDCAPNPCRSGTCTDGINEYTCVCPPGLMPPNCEDTHDDCEDHLVTYNGVNYTKHICNFRDTQAVCVDKVGYYECTCSQNYTGTYCDIPAGFLGVAELIFGDKSPEELGEVIKDLQTHPPKLQDLIPFITGAMSEDERSELSWTHGDLFMDAAFERKSIDVEKNFVVWNDVVLGNCFTFNHDNSTTMYKRRNNGRNWGLYVQMKVKMTEYPGWVDTAAITVFVHRNSEMIFGESNRFKAEPGASTNLLLYQNEYSRLNGKYGKCVHDKSEVASYYYTGRYTTDGCLRSCYQDLVDKHCDCMDPRYPFPGNKKGCDLGKRICMLQLNDEYGDDPSQWKFCGCPQPCADTDFRISWTKAPYQKISSRCNFSSNRTACQQMQGDLVEVNVQYSVLAERVYKEEPAMGLNKFISYLGGILGVIMGISVVTFIEFGFLLVTIGAIFSGKKV